MSYANCGLPYYVGDVITDKRKLTLQSPKSFRGRFDIDVRVRQEVIGINRAAKTALVRNLEDGLEYEPSYDSLILSPGAQAVKPDLPGIDDRRILTLRTVEDTFAMKQRTDELIEQGRARAVVIGGGFIGIGGGRKPGRARISRHAAAAQQPMSCRRSITTWHARSTPMHANTDLTCG